MSLRKLGAELVGTALLLAAVVGSGIMGEQLAAGNAAIALLANSVATGAALFVLITMLGPISGAHFNPVVTLVALLRGELRPGEALAYAAVQLAGAVLGVLVAHAMFDMSVLQVSVRVRTGMGQWLAEAVATFGLVATILLTLKARPEQIASSVALYITAAYWFTASTSFANPAVTLARTMTATFAGIRPADAAGFIAAQVAGAMLALGVAAWLIGDGRQAEEKR